MAFLALIELTINNLLQEGRNNMLLMNYFVLVMH
jgi:hypothetical protein